jgi:hypothetical protein
MRNGLSTHIASGAKGIALTLALSILTITTLHVVPVFHSESLLCYAQVDQNEATLKWREGDFRLMEQIKKVVFHLDWDQEEPLTMSLENIKNLFKTIPSEQCRVRLVANGKAVNLFHKDRVGAHAPNIEELHKLGVRFMACNNALTKNNMDRQDLFHLCDIVPAGVVELINLQAQGFAYIKP